MEFDKTELQRLMQDQGVDPTPEEEKGPEPVRKKVGRVLMLLVMIAYFAVLLFGKYYNGPPVKTTSEKIIVNIGVLS